MDHGEGFAECWKDFMSKSDHTMSVVDYLKANQQILQPQMTEHLLSIGPGTGEIDRGIVDLLPNLISYTGVDPNAVTLDVLRDKMEDCLTLEKHFVNDIMETYTGSLCASDLILMSHVTYNFRDSVAKQICRTLSWLKKEGRLLLIHSNKLNNLVAKGFDVSTVEDMRQHLADMKVNFTEVELGYTLDMSQLAPCHSSFVSILMNHRASKDEVDRVLALIGQDYVPGTQKVKVSQSLFIIQKPQEEQLESLSNRYAVDTVPMETGKPGK